MSERKRLVLLILILTFVSLSIVSTTFYILYNAAFDEARARLVNIAQSRARLIESVAAYDEKVASNFDIHEYDPFAATMSQINEAHRKFEGFGRTGEFTLAKREGDIIDFLLRHRHSDVSHPEDIPFASKLAEPMRLALSGKSGTIIGLDYRGERVLAAFEPLSVNNLGIVAKMDLSEVRAPFITAAMVAGVVSSILTLLGAILFSSVTNPMIKKIANSEARFRSIFESKMTGIIFWNMSGDITDANDRFLELVGYSRDDLLSGKMSWSAMTPPEFEEADRLAISGLTSTGEMEPLEKEYIRKDGSRLPIILTASTLPGSELNGVAFVLDNTERKQGEKDRKNLEMHLRQGQKLEAIGTLAGGVAHEINNPINGIMNYAQLIGDKLDAESPLREYTEEIKHETERVSIIVRNLLTFSRQEKESHSPAEIEDIVKSSTSLIGTVITRDQIMLEVDIPDNLPTIRCRSQQIQQVLMNLMTNARDALNARYPDYNIDKKMMINVRQFEKDEVSWIRISVEDHGNGIPDTIRDRIFDPFFTTKDRTKGTGLGLSISYGIVEDHHGEMHVECEAGRFTRFHVDLRVNNGWSIDNACEEATRKGEV